MLDLALSNKAFFDILFLKLKLHLLDLLLRPGRGAEYCNQFVCVYVSVCLRAYLWNR